MSLLTDWINKELYPALFERIDTAFPELRFTRTGRGVWQSPLKIDGTEPKQSRKDKTIVSGKYAGILEQGGEFLSFVDYVKRRDGVEFIEAVRALASVTGLTLPEREGFNAQEYAKRARSLSVLEAANSYFTYHIEQEEASELRGYLERRGYSLEEVKVMGLGYVPSQDRLRAYLTKQGYSREEIEEALPLSADTRIGTSHRLSIPYRSGGNIHGFKFRTIGADHPKYINSKGLDRSSGFFNMSYVKGDKDLTIVEGELDALHATAAGIDNIVATGGSNVTEEAVKDAISRGAKRFTLCFDNEPGKEDKSTRSAIATILKHSSQVYIAQLPDLGGDKTDPDRLIKEQGAEGLRQAIEEAIPYYIYELNDIIRKYGNLQEEAGSLTWKQREDLIREVVSSGATIKEPLHKAAYERELLSIEPLQELGLTEDRLRDILREQEAEQLQQQQQKAAEQLLKDSGRLIEQGEVKDGLSLLKDKLREVSTIAKAAEFGEFLIPNSLEAVAEKLRNKPPGLYSGYKAVTYEDGKKRETDITFRAGALSFIAAPTSHGKTSFLINAILKAVADHPAKQFHLFSYEESAEAIIRNTLNTYAAIDLSRNNRGTIEGLLTGSSRYVHSYHQENIQPFQEKQREFSELLSSGRLIIHYTEYSAEDLLELIAHLNERGNIGGVFIDYMQLLHKGNRGRHKYNSRQEELKQICIELKDTAVTTQLPIVLGAQFNREVVNPLLLHTSKIGEAGDIERIASLIVGLWDTNKAAITDSKEGKEIAEKGELLSSGRLYMKVLKNREGETGGEASYKYDGNLGKIYGEGEQAGSSDNLQGISFIS